MAKKSSAPAVFSFFLLAFRFARGWAGRAIGVLVQDIKWLVPQIKAANSKLDAYWLAENSEPLHPGMKVIAVAGTLAILVIFDLWVLVVGVYALLLAFRSL